MRKATISFICGWVVTIPAEGMAPRLFLEALSAIRPRRKFSLTVLPTIDREGSVLKIRIDNEPRETFREIAYYINNLNLPDQ